MSAIILVLAQHAADRALWRELLERRGHLVFTAQALPDLLQQFDLLHPDLVLLDLWMTDLNPYGICRELKYRAIRYSAPIVLVAPDSSEASRIRGIDAGADAVIAPPVLHHNPLFQIQLLLALREYTPTQAP